MSMNDSDDENENDIDEMLKFIDSRILCSTEYTAKILKINIHTNTFFLIGKLVLFWIAALLIFWGRSNEMSLITPEIALFIVVRAREILASLSIMPLQWSVSFWTDSWGRENGQATELCKTCQLTMTLIIMKWRISQPC